MSEGACDVGKSIIVTPDPGPSRPLQISFSEAILLIVSQRERTLPDLLSYFAPGADRETAEQWVDRLATEGLIKLRASPNPEQIKTWKVSLA